MDTKSRILTMVRRKLIKFDVNEGYKGLWQNIEKLLLGDRCNMQ